MAENNQQGIFLTSVEKVANWAMAKSEWPVTMGLACCAIEMMAFGTPRFDASRFGMEVFRASPRQSDLMIVSGRVSHRMAPVVRDVYDKMADPKWVISMGVCASSGGMFNNYAVVQGCDHIVPVDVYLPGCPPRPEMLIDAVGVLRRYVMENHKITKKGRVAAARAAEQAALDAVPIEERKGLLAA
ncbi:MAG: NADH-quinone oxidoreductase subunit B family protein [Actinomycetaceae bacterium]|nr:NADH-quinone oxidoreductase subunit B [Actinomycetaceae bacterium]MDY6082686.1 NADH-quinone oxidoreductase subunit B family protein [Actinomycetaceae bacterium]